MSVMYKLATLQSTYISSVSPYSSFLGSKIIKAGNDITRTPVREYMSLLQFDISQIPLAEKIISAHLILSAQLVNGVDTDKLLCSKLNEGFDENVATWNNYSDIDKTVISNLILNQLVFTVDVTEVLKSWVAKPMSNYGIAIAPATNSSDIMADMYSSVSQNEPYEPVIVVEYNDMNNDFTDMGNIIVEKTQSNGLTTFDIYNYRAEVYSAQEDYKNIISVVQVEKPELARIETITQGVMNNETGVFVPASQSTSITTDALGGTKQLAVIGNKAPKLVSFIYKTVGGSYNLNHNIFVKTTLDTLMSPINKPEMYAALNYDFVAPTGSNITVDKDGIVTVPVNAPGGKVKVGYNVKGIDTQSIEFENDIEVYTAEPANLDTEFSEPGTAIFTNLVKDTDMVISSGNVLTVGTKYLNFYTDTSEDYKADVMFIVSQPLTNVTAKVERSTNGGTSYTTIVDNVNLGSLGKQFFLNQIVKGTIPSLVNLANVNEIYRITFTNTITEPIKARIGSFNVAGKLKALSNPQVIDEANMKYLNQNVNKTLNL